MRIERIRLSAFGRLRDLDTGPDALPGLVVVHGPNEAGKSTLFHFLTSMLYGFHPASRESNPYTPWGEGDPSGIVTLSLEGGGCVDVERRLRSQPTARMSGPDGVDDLRNRPIPWVEHVPRTVFRQVFAVTLAELASLDGEAWDRVQDRIIGSMGASDLLPSRHVAAELEREAGELWRPTRRGNQRIRDLQDSLLGLRERRRVAVENDRRLRSAVAEATLVRERLDDAREARQRTHGTLDRLQELVPVHRQLRRIEALETTAGDPAQLEGLPRDPAAQLATWEERSQSLRERLTDLQDERSAPMEAVASFDDARRSLLTHEDRVRSFVARVGTLGPDRARMAALKQETRDLARRTETTAERILSPATASSEMGALAAIPVAELRERVRRARSARDERLLLEASLQRGDEGRRPRAAWWAPALLVVGGSLLAYGLSTSSLWATAVGSAAAAVALPWLVARLTRRAHQGDSSADALAVATMREDEASASVSELFKGLSVLPSALDPPTDGLVNIVERVGELVRDQAERAQSGRELRHRAESVDREAGELAASVGIEEDNDALAVAHALDEALRGAEMARQAAKVAERDLARIAREEERLAGELRKEEVALEALLARVAAAGEGDVSAGVRVLRTRLDARDRAVQLMDELERAHPNLDQIRHSIASAEAKGESWAQGDQHIGQLKSRLQDETEAIERLVAQAEALERDAAHLREAETVDGVDGEAAALQEEVAALLRERDRKWVLAHALREADRRFREEHQPDLMRRASEYLAHLTRGRYNRITADETGGRDRFQIHGAGLPRPIPLVPPVSTGTLEQAYLSLRLAIVDHLDQGRERLPLFADEVFVNWDRTRRLRGMQVLAGIATRRQLFVFTCHETLAEDLRSNGAAVLTLGDDG